MSAILFEVIDVACEQADQGFFQPAIVLTTKSTTQFAQLYGFNEFVPSTPPKKYRKATVSGTSERIGFTCEQTPRQCAGANYTWSGFSEYNLKGNLIASYSKKFYAQCAKQFWPDVGSVQLNPFASIPCPSNINCKFVGFCWPLDPNSCPVCDPNIVNWPLIGDVTQNILALDLQGFLFHPNDLTVTSTSFAVASNYAAFTGLGFAHGPAFGTGNFYNITVGAATYHAEEAIVTPATNFPVVFVEKVAAPYINWVDASNYSCVLSEEYTDAEALANAQIVNGTGSTASNQPRTTGFVSVFTSVVFTLHCSNLQVGKDYLVSVDLWESSSLPTINKHTIRQYGFTATKVTQELTDIIPTPDPFHTITVSKPTIAFSNP